MSRTVIPGFVFFLISIAQAQKIDYFVKDGYVIDGYDVVSYFTDQVQKGRQDYVYEYDGVQFQFASQEHLALFKANPQKYIPQYGGYCAYAIAAKSKKVSVDPETFTIRDGKLYLFYNNWGINTLKKWQKSEPKSLQSKADKNWTSIKYR